MKKDSIQTNSTNATPPTPLPPIVCWVGLDWADQRHCLVVRTRPAGPSQTHRLDQKPEKLDEFFLGLRAQNPQGRIAVAIEQSRGPAPAWSPDGQQIAFASDRDQATGVYSIYLMNADGSSVKRLTNDQGIDYSPAWSPDGRQIAFRAHHGGPADIYVINVDGSNLRALTNNQGDNWSPSWSPDGTSILFQTNRDGNWEIYLMNADGSSPRNLTNHPADDQYPNMKP